MEIEEAIKLCREFYGDSIPKTVSEYQSNFPAGLGRTAIKSKFGLTGGQFLKLIGSEYKEQEPTRSKIIKGCEERNLTILSKLPKVCTVKTEFQVFCNDCEDTFTTYWDTLCQTKKGCKSCNGMKNWSDRIPELAERANVVGSTLVNSSGIRNQKDYVSLRCDTCSTEYSVMVVKLANPQSDNEGKCQNCLENNLIVLDGVTFRSQFERDCYKLLKPFNPKLQVRYSIYHNTTRQWTCDFVLGNCWVEVSNYRPSSQGYENYITNIEEKRKVVEMSNKSFFFLTSLREVRDFINKI